MADIDDIINQDEFRKDLVIPEVIKSPHEVETAKQKLRDQKVKSQVEHLFKTKKRATTPTPTELKTLITNYFEKIYPENYAMYTLHTYLGMTQHNIEVHILPNDELKEIYDFAIEKLKAKAELTMQMAGRSTDGFAMQNLAGWRKKDPEEEEQTSGLAELHKSIREHKSKKAI